ncbi:unnamed protein product [Microthlaspi erraticum]|uniref:F-box domain-containing protein n=1 Tax=Microthlaspi erraticum TaxID=1685480 RepID=A0A6D2KZ00_9BRAS|nr:unnamed protein product [Microthlaspi erraticum]
MRRVRRKESIEKRETDLFSILPLDLIVEILLRTPAKSTASLVLVSKQWLSILRGKKFTNLYVARSSTRKRLLSAVFDTYLKQIFLLSCSQEDPSSSDHRMVKITDQPSHRYYFSAPVRGLICRQIDSKVMMGKHPHLISSYITKQICINGVVYYYAWVTQEISLISFDLISEEFNVIKLPEDIPVLVKYTGKVALASWSENKLDVWVLEDAKKQEWSKVSIVLPFTINLVFVFRGTLSTGELIFSPFRFVRHCHFISYDLKENKAEKVVVKGNGDHFPKHELYFDHVESPMFLPNVS